MLPEPALTFTIPSVHDGLALDCRIYHTASLKSWRRHAAVLAHPYAPLGGSFDDPVVEVVGAKMLEEGYLLATFNFRGAGHSAGKTSWTSKAERADFQSVIAFLAYYVHHLDPFTSADADADAEDGRSPSSHIDDMVNEDSNDRPAEVDGRQTVLIIGGYSYGSLIAAQLPPLETVLEPFAAPPSASHEAQIRLRAASLAAQQSTRIRLALAVERSATRRSPSKCGVRVGGDEGDLSPRRSADGGGRRSRSVSRELEGKLHELAAKTKSSLAAQRRHHRHVSSETTNMAHSTGTLDKVPEESPGDGPSTTEERPVAAEGHLPRLVGFAAPRQAYLLLSPIPGLASHLVTLRVLPGAVSRSRWWRSPEEDCDNSGVGDPAEAKLVRYPTLAVRGGADSFVLPYKGREWSARLEGTVPRSQFRGVEVPTAGHFWAEEGVLDRLLELVGEFAHGLAGDASADEGTEAVE